MLLELRGASIIIGLQALLPTKIAEAGTQLGKTRPDILYTARLAAIVASNHVRQAKAGEITFPSK